MDEAEGGAVDRARQRVRATPRRRTLGRDLAALGVVAVLLVGALGAAVAVLYRDLYSPQAFVSRYLDLLSRGQAAEALALPGVTIDSAEVADGALPAAASDALLRSSALAPLSGASVTGTADAGDGITAVTVEYDAGPHHGTTTFRVESAGWIGVAPAWRFAQSPLAAIELTVAGSRQFVVNGFALDTRQISPDGAGADPLEPVAMLVFSPGLYSISVDTAIATSPGVAVLSDAPEASIPVAVKTQATEKFRAAVQGQVESFLTECATQQVLQPTGCPFGLVVQNRIVSPPVWAMEQQPAVALSPQGADWVIDRAQAVARIAVDIRAIADGTIRPLDEAVPFFVGGTVTILPDNTASIQVTDGS